MMKLSEQMGALRQEGRRPARRYSNTITSMVTLRNAVLDQLVFTVPPLTRKTSSLKTGGRIWFIVDGRTLTISGKPWGPHTESEWRMVNRPPEVRCTTQQKVSSGRSWRNRNRRAEVEA